MGRCAAAAGDTLRKDAARLIGARLQADLNALEQGGGVSLLAKWLPSVNTSSAARQAQAKRLCALLGMPQRDYRRALARLRSAVDVLEKRLCAVDYSFDYARQPSGAMHKYRRAFLRHDKDRYVEYLDRVRRGEAALHAGTLFPYEIIRACLIPPVEGICSQLRTDMTPELIQSLDAAWKSLPDYGDSRNALAVIDGSGSMYCEGNPLPAEVAVSLGIYFAEHNRGHFRDHFITFSNTPRLVRLKGDNIVDRAMYCMSYNECANTDLRATFLLLLETALKNDLSQEELPETLYVISDMEFDAGVVTDRTLFQELKALFEENGYRLPRLVYWNVNSLSEQIPVRRHESGAVLVSGGSPSLFRMVIGQDIYPESFMLSVLNSERYREISA